jgi:hypothetical protein
VVSTEMWYVVQPEPSGPAALQRPEHDYFRAADGAPHGMTPALRTFIRQEDSARDSGKCGKVGSRRNSSIRVRGA